MALNTPENVNRLLSKLIEAIDAGSDINSLVSNVDIDDDTRSLIEILTKRINYISKISKLSKRVNELELNIQGTSTAEQNRIARNLASKRASSSKRKMSYYEKLGGLGYKLDSQGGLIEASRYYYLKQKYYNRYVEFGDDGRIENKSEALRLASILAERQVRNEREEEERKRQEKENAEKASRQEANIGARSRYRDAMRDISDPSHMERRRLYESFLEVDESTGKSSLDQRKAATKKAREVSAAEEERKRQEKENAEKASRQEANIGARGRYRDSMREIRDPSHMKRKRLYESFLEVDESTGKSSLDQRKVAAKKAREVLAAEKANTKGVNENTKALTGLRAILGPYAKAVMPFYGAKMFYDLTKSDTSASLARVNRRTFGGLYRASGNPRRGYRRMFDAMTSYGASEQDVMREYAGQKKWASTLMFGMGLDKIEALAMVLGKAPGPAEMRDPELMQRWLRENMRGITDTQALQLSSMGVASDAFIESARKGQAVDTEGETARIHSRYKTLYEQQGGWENPFRKIQFGIGRDNANAIAEGSLTGFIYEFEMDVLRKLGNVWGALFSKNETGTTSPRDEYGIIPRQTSVTVNINGNIDSEERVHSFAEQIGAEVSNAEK